MKRNILYLVLCVNLLVSMTGCYEDKSTEATIEIPEIVIDTTGIGGNIVLRKFDPLQLAPKVSKEGTDASQFSYKWMLSLKPVKFGTDDAYECIGEDKDLDIKEFNRDDDETTYRLWYQVTDKTTGLRKDMIWTVRVLATYGEGLLVAEEVDGGTDLALIESEEFSEGYEDQPLIRHGIYSQANEGGKIDSDLTQLTAWREGNNSYTKYYLILGKNGDDKYLLLDKNYRVKYRNEEGFIEYAVDKVEPTQFVTFTYAVYLINGNDLHWLFTSPNSSNMQWSAPVPYSGSYVKLNYLAGGMYTGYNYSFYYDKENSCFRTLYNTLMRWDLASIAKGTSDRTLGIDPGNCPDVEMIFGGPGPDKKVYGLLRNTKNGNYSILGLNSSSNKFNAYYEIPSCELDNAIDYACYEMGNVFYFATSHKVYAILLNAEPVNVVEIYSSTDEITHMSIFRQAKNATHYSSATLKGSAETILLTTWDGSKGTVHSIPIKNLDTGELNTAEAKKYGDFGKISKVIHQYP